MHWTAFRGFLAAAAAMLAVFCGLFQFRSPTVSREPPRAGIQLPETVTGIPLHLESWKRIRHGALPLGYAHVRISGDGASYQVRERMRMRVRTLGVVQDLDVTADARLNDDFTLRSVAMRMISGLFALDVQAEVSGGTLTIRTLAAGDERRLTKTVPGPPYTTTGVFLALAARGVAAGERYRMLVFDPTTLDLSGMRIDVGDAATLTLQGERHEARELRVGFRGAEQRVWMARNGDLLKESGFFGMEMEASVKADALAAFESASAGDISLAASLPSDRLIERPAAVHRLRVRLHGARWESGQLAGGRQQVEGGLLEVRRETLDGAPRSMEGLAIPAAAAAYLSAEPRIQSDHRDITAIAARLADENPDPVDRLRAVVAWVHRHLHKRPVLSVPDALSTLRRGAGDCNEHAVLTAALSRAAGLPAKIEVGLVYQEGRFFYHAWNSVFVGGWVTADAVFDQVPADATHIRLSEGVEGLGLLPFVGRLRIQVVDVATDRPGGAPS